MDKPLRIGQIAERTGVAAKTIRYYEEVGVLPPPRRTESGYRSYSETDVRRVELVRRAKLLDMPLSELKNLVQWAGDGSCNDFQERFRETVRHKIGEVDRRIQELRTLNEELAHLEAHLAAGERRTGHADHPMIACSPETCACLGSHRPADSPGSTTEERR